MKAYLINNSKFKLKTWANIISADFSRRSLVPSVEVVPKLRRKKAAQRIRCFRLCSNSTGRKCMTCSTRSPCPTNRWLCRTWARSARVHSEAIRRLQEELLISAVPTNLLGIRRVRQSWATSWLASRVKRAFQSPTAMQTTVSQAGMCKMGKILIIWIL